jgi:carbon-monoxide dehydrogenase small subunit
LRPLPLFDSETLEHSAGFDHLDVDGWRDVRARITLAGLSTGKGESMRRVALTVNGVGHDVELEPRELLVYVLRDRLGLTGTNVGCDTSSCGSCTVLVNGESVKSCTMLGVQADGVEITTIEGLARNGELHPVQQAFHDHHALQCGYCTPGMVLAAVSLIESGAATDEAAIREGLEGNLCRCTGYHNVVQAIASAAGVA